MSLNRIQKLLFSEYCDFEDMVLVESPFAQTTKDGLGLRQVQLGLTPTKLVLAVDVLPPVQESNIFYNENIDPETETLELVAVYPVECVNLSIYRRRKRQSIKAHFCNNRILYFELGGFEKRKMFWNLWCERIKFLSPDDVGSSVSETSVATSTSASSATLNVTSEKFGKNGKTQIWCKFEDKPNKKNCKWVENYLYMDGSSDDFSAKNSTKFCTKLDKGVEKSINNLKNKYVPNLNNTDKNNLNQHASGDYADMHNNNNNNVINSLQSSSASYATDVLSVYPITVANAEETNNQEKKDVLTKKLIPDRERHPRKYGLIPQAHFLYGLGPWNIYTGDRVSTQLKRCASAVRIRRQPDNPEFHLPISKRLLTVSISCEAFHLNKGLNIDTCISKLAVPEAKALLFWTPEYWYRPQPARDSYKEFLDYIQNLNANKLQFENKKVLRQKKRIKRMKIHFAGEKKAAGDNKMNNREIIEEKSFESYLQRLRAALKIELALTAWDFDSTTLAYQLIMIDKELFLKIKPYELDVITWQRCSKNAPNISSLIAFSHRISCLICTEILRDDNDNARGRLIVKFINVAEKCDSLSSFQSCRSILSGLQSPPIYRLHSTWGYLRKHHAVKYELFENLCRKYADPCLESYQKSFHSVIPNPPFLPYIGDILCRLIDRNPQVRNKINEDIKEHNLIINETVEKQNQTDNNITQYHGTGMKNFSKFFTTSVIQRRLIQYFHTLKMYYDPENIVTAKNSISGSTISTRKSSKVKIKSEPKIEQVKNVSIKSTDEESNIRKKRLKNALEFLNICQTAAAKYALNTNEIAMEYLLKARYREDKENFYNSFKIEQKPVPRL